MERLAKCKSLTVIFKDDKVMLDGPHKIELDVGENKKFHIRVEQCGIRKIIITSGEDVSVFELNALFSRIERLLMMLDGIFIPLSEMQFSESDTVEESMLRSCEQNFLAQRLSYFTSASIAYSKFMWKIISQAHPFCMSNDILPDVR